MNKLNIGTRLALGFLLILLLLAVIAAVGFWRIQASTAMAEEVIDRRLTAERLITQWGRETALNAVRTLAVGQGLDLDTRRQFEKAIVATGENIRRIQGDLSAHITDPAALQLFDAAKGRQEQYVERRDHALRAQAAGDIQTAHRFFETEAEGLLDAYTASVDELLALTREHIDTRALMLYQNNDWGLRLLSVLSLAALAAGLLLAFAITRSITVPLRRAVALAGTVSNRDLTSTIDVRGTDETSQLLQALKQMNDNLMEVVADVRGGAGSIASAASQIAAGNVDLSSRTEEQASSLAETAATMEQLTATVRRNAEHAQTASGLALSAAEVAVKSSEVVAKVVDTMGAINDSSRQVVDIISVIDAIAFQTNILALNAAVEAARAGEQGRGFAVVASEVRALAQRSASAAKEIKTLIDASVATAGEGNQLVTEAGARMAETVSSVERVTHIMSEITAASQEQSVGIEQVNQAVSQMDQVTQQNAALVEEAAAAADSLRDQSSVLARLVATFRLDEAATRPALKIAQ